MKDLVELNRGESGSVLVLHNVKKGRKKYPADLSVLTHVVIQLVVGSTNRVIAKFSDGIDPQPVGFGSVNRDNDSDGYLGFNVLKSVTIDLDPDDLIFYEMKARCPNPKFAVGYSEPECRSRCFKVGHLSKSTAVINIDTLT